jgi:hypothetical protein
MLTKFLKRFRVSEVHLCLPFVQITVEAIREETGVAPEINRVPEAKSEEPLPLAAREVVNLNVQERASLPGITIAPLAAELATVLSFRLATQIDTFGPVFPPHWQPVEKGIQLRPGDFLWLRLHCRNDSNRVIHNVRIAMEGIEIARKQSGILVRGVNGWPRSEVRNVFIGQELSHINPGEDYSLHCVLRVPVDIHKNEKARFRAIKPEFSILKQLHE